MTTNERGGPDAPTREHAASTRLEKPNRRTFLKTVGAGAVVATLGSTPAVGAFAPEMTNFVETRRTAFVVDDQPIYFNGTNNFWITDNHATRARVDDREAVLTDWITEMSAYIKDLDPNHLVSTGMEGFYTRDGASEFFYNDWTGQDYIRHHDVDTIDACSFHMYPSHWDHPDPNDPDDGSPFPLSHGTEWIREHVVDAHEELGKPAYCGEFNVNRERGLETRNDYLAEWYDLFDEYDIGAPMPWQVVLESTNDHDGFQIYRSESGDILESYGETAAAKTGVANDGPLADATSPDTLRLGEAGRFSAAYSTGGGRELSSYEWVFGDGTTATGETVVHRFDQPGEYEVEVTVTDDARSSATDTEAVTVVEIPDDAVLVEGAGEGVFDDVAEFHVAFQEQVGGFTVDAKVSSVESTDPDAQAGIIALEDLDAEGAVGGVSVTPSAGTEIDRAYDELTPIWRERSDDDRSPPLWLRLEYEDGVMTGYVSADGEDWTIVETGESALGEEYYVGLFVSSNSPGDLCTVQFNGVDWLEEFENTDVGDVEVAGNAISGTGDGDDDGSDEPEALDVTGDGNPAQDLSGDGLYEDVTGDDRLSFDDVVTFFEEHESTTIQDNVEYFDFSDNGRVSFDDVIALFERI